MRTSHLLAFFFLLTVILYPQYSAGSHSISKENSNIIDLDIMFKETQLFSEDINKMAMVWWIPNEYWLGMAQEDPLYDEILAQETIKLLEPYIVTFILLGKVGTFGGIKYESVEKIYDKSKIVFSDNHSLHPIDRNEIDPDAKNFLDVMKPVFANTMGEMGENMQYVLFSAKYQNGDYYINPKEKDHFIVHVSNEEFKFKLPLASLFPKKSCPNCGEKLNGLYSFCPYDGYQLMIEE